MSLNYNQVPDSAWGRQSLNENHPRKTRRRAGTLEDSLTYIDEHKAPMKAGWGDFPRCVLEDSLTYIDERKTPMKAGWGDIPRCDALSCRMIPGRAARGETPLSDLCGKGGSGQGWE